MTKKANENVRYTLATHAAERLFPSGQAVSFCERIADGHMTGDQAVAQIKRMYGIEAGCKDA